MGIWGFSSAVTLVVIFFFGYTLFVILKQRRLSEVQKDFINNMTHEFKTPISTIAISAQVLKDPKIANNPERLLNYANIIDQENQRLKQQVERVLQMAELDKGEIGLKNEDLDIHKLTTEVVAGRRIGMEGTIELNLTAETFVVKGDSLHLSNVLGNLIDNAIKYNQNVPHIKVTTKNTEGYLELSVQDNGIGIASSEKEKIFDKFYRVPTGNIHNAKGFGLGLSYVKGIVEKHHGRISVQSIQGSGSTFRIILPTIS